MKFAKVRHRYDLARGFNILSVDIAIPETVVEQNEVKNDLQQLVDFFIYKHKLRRYNNTRVK